jgi:hypothetical protein
LAILLWGEVKRLLRAAIHHDNVRLIGAISNLKESNDKCCGKRESGTNRENEERY